MAKCCIKIPLEMLGGIYGSNLFYLTGVSLVKGFSLPSPFLYLPHSFLPSYFPFPPLLSTSFLSLSFPPSLPLDPSLPSFYSLSFPFPSPSHLLHPWALLVYRTSGSGLYWGKGKYYQVSVNICSSFQSSASGTLGSDHLGLFQIDVSLELRIH